MRPARLRSGSILVIAIAGLVGFSTGCGNESVVSGSADLRTTVTTTSEPETTEDAAPPTTREREPVEPDAAEEPQLDARGERFVSGLREAGVQPYGHGEHAVGTAQYVCAAQSDGVPADDVLVNVTAMVGLEMQLSGSDGTVDDIAKTYIDVAERDYCGE